LQKNISHWYGRINSAALPDLSKLGHIDETRPAGDAGLVADVMLQVLQKLFTAKALQPEPAGGKVTARRRAAARLVRTVVSAQDRSTVEAVGGR
jgi:hypothetical protein